MEKSFEDIDQEINEISDDVNVNDVERMEDGINLELFVYHDQLPRLIELLNMAKGE